MADQQFEERIDTGIKLILERIEQLQKKVHKIVDDLRERKRGGDA